ncbi:aminoglycoside phosphotransferase family protein [Streptomyces sp. NPDC005485]|uniref:phosphotransferase family protein n=1 Tax=Streptomyces sp. NPDC005485 TaxID=3155591 RepID=UPI00339FF0E7
MLNHHRRQLDREQLDHVLAASGIDPALIRACTELSDATFNTAYRLRLADSAEHSGLVLKVAPHPDAPTLSHEPGIMRTEEMFYRATAGKAPVPEVVHADFTRKVIGSDFLLMSELPGGSWFAERERIADDDRTRMRAELGGMVAALHEVTGPGYGYPQFGDLAPDWRTAFLSMVDAVLTDADTFASVLPRTTERIRRTIRARADVLDEVVVPVLVHFDLWDGNILVDRTPEGRTRISGLVDGERAFWGDPVAELVSLGLFQDIEQDEPYLSGYRAAGGHLVFDSATRLRLSLYRSYLYLIMLVETTPRGFSGPEQQERTRYVSGLLDAELDNLSAAQAG